MAVLRTPDERFANIPDYPFAPQYVDLAAAVGRSGEARMHYVDEGSGEVVLSTWNTFLDHSPITFLECTK